MTVRFATPDDENRLLELLLLLQVHDNPVSQLCPPATDKMLAQIEVGTRPDPESRTMAGDNRRGLIGVIDGDEQIAGTIGLFFQEPWYSTMPVLMLLWLLVRPEARRERYEDELFMFGRSAIDKMQASHDAAVARGDAVPMRFWMYFGYEATTRREVRDRLWGRYGTWIGSNFLYPEPG
jgi:hypothetical protein